MNWSYIAIIVAALIGVGIAVYIRRKKMRPSEAMVCPIGSDCRSVITSEFSSFLGIPIEIMGMAYYGLLVIAYVVFSSMDVVPTTLSLVAYTVTLFAFLFSAYLTFIQTMYLREYCTWCLSSAGLSTLIFLVVAFGTNHGAIEFLTPYRLWIIPLHLFGLALGLGGATIADFLFFRFLKDLRISHFEANTLHLLSQVVWLGLAILLVTGTGLFVTDLTLLTSAKFLTKLVVVTVIIVNGSFLNLYITPRLIHISFGDTHEHVPGELRRARRLAYALGAISATSWYWAFGLGVMPYLAVSIWFLLALYFGTLVIAVAGSQVLEQIIARRGSVTPSVTRTQDEALL